MRSRRQHPEEQPRVRISLTEWKGAQLLNLRVWFSTGSGEMRPSKDGLALRIERLPDFTAAIAMAHAEALAAGLIPGPTS